MHKEQFIQDGNFGCLFFLTEEILPSAVVFQVLAKQEIPFDYGNLPATVTTGIDPQTSLDATKISSVGRAIQGREIEDLFYFDDVDILLHTVMNVYPRHMRVFPYWIAGYLQSDYHDILTASKESPFGFRESPIEFMVIPKARLEFAFRNPYGTEKINPYISWTTGIYKIRYMVDAQLVEAVLSKRLRVPWFTIYGFKKFPYDFKANLKITRPIDITADRSTIEEILKEWRALGVWK